MNQSNTIFRGCMPALMTPCDRTGEPDFDALVATGKHLVSQGMSAVVYCGSMGDWPLLSDAERQAGVEALVKANLPVVVGTGAQNTKLAVQHAEHAANVGAHGLMVIPRVLSRGSSATAQAFHFSSVLSAAADLPAVIYNSPYYGFETKADLFQQLRIEHANLIGFKEFGGARSMSYAAQHITNESEEVMLMVGVDTQVIHGFLNCDAQGAITGVGNALPREILCLVSLCEQAKSGDPKAKNLAVELNDALSVLSQFDEGPDLVLYYKHLMVLEGHEAYRYHFNPHDQLTPSQRRHLDNQWQQFRTWWGAWSLQNKSHLELAVA